MKRITESDSYYRDLEKLSTRQLLEGINKEDHRVPEIVQTCIPAIESLVNAIVDKMLSGGRLFYLGAGTSGRLGIVDASELPPTYGIDHGIVIGLIAGGDDAIRKAVEFAEDDPLGGWKDLTLHSVNQSDFVIGIAASGTTPYVIGALEECKKHNILTGCITCNENAPLIQFSDYKIVAVVGPEFVTGSTRMKAGTAQKLILNMISTAVMIKLGRVVGNKMVDMQLTNNKLVDRGTMMVMEATGLSYEEAKKLLIEKKSARAAIKSFFRD